MKLLLFLMLFHPDTTNWEAEKDTSIFKRLMMNTEMSFKLNFHFLLGGKQKPEDINAQNEYSKYKQYESIGVSTYGYRKPEELGYALSGTFRCITGFDLATTIRFKKYQPVFIYGLNLAFERREYQTTSKLRKEIINLYEADLISQGYSRPNSYVNDDTLLQRKRVEAFSFVIPVALRFPIKNNIGLEAGTFINVIGVERSITTGGSISILGQNTLISGIKPNPYFAIYCNIRNKFILQFGGDFTKTVFLSFQI